MGVRFETTLCWHENSRWQGQARRGSGCQAQDPGIREVLGKVHGIPRKGLPSVFGGFMRR